MKTKNEMNFWSYEKCEYCGGKIVGKDIEVCRKFGKKYAVIKGVPAGVCHACGTRYFSASVLKSMSQIGSGRLKAKREIEIGVYSL